MNKLASCHKALPVAVLLALLLCAHSQTTSAQSSGGLSASASGSLGGSNGGISGQANADASLVGGNGIGGGSSSGSAQAQVSGTMNGGSVGGGSASASGSVMGGGESSGGATVSAGGSASLGSSAASVQSTTTFEPSTPKPEGLFSKMKDMVKTSLSMDDKKEQEPKSGSASMSASASVSSSESGKQKGLMDKLGDAAKKGKELVKDTAKGVKEDVKSILKPGESAGSGKEGPMAKLMNKGQEMVHKIENKASEIGHEIAKPLTGGSGSSVKADAQIKIGGGGGGGSASASASARAQAGQQTKGTEKSLAVEMLDKVHEVSMEPVEQALKPIDKALGYKEDPLVKAIGQTESMLRKPVSDLAKPVEAIISGAFHTSEEAKLEQERLMSEQERREIRLREERARKEGRSVLGQITDKTVELAEKPFEVVMKQIGLEKKGQKNPLLKLIDEIYGLTKKPIDMVAKPFEDILRKMAQGEQDYQLSVRFANSDNDPKLFTRLADGALNIADRVVTRPIEFVMRPLGYDNKKNRNPIVDATHSLKNATKIGLELFMRPIDRIIKEIADIGDIKDEVEREAEIQRRRQDASRIVAALDKLHEVAQAPFEIVLKPVSKVLGYEGKKDPLMRTWDIAHEVAMVPLQVLGKPLEDAILGERRRARLNVKSEVKVGGQGQARVSAKASVSGGQGGGPASAAVARAATGERRKNVFADGIRKIEKFAAKPIDVITSPIRKLILGEDDKIGAGKGFQAKAKAKVGPIQASAKVQTGTGMNNQPDKIVTTIKNINNVVLRPLELITQPISDIVTGDNRKVKTKVDVKVQGSTQMRGQDNVHASMSAAAGASMAPASGSTQMRVQENAHASMLASPVASKVSASGSVSGPGLGQAQASGSLVTPVGTISGSAALSG